MIGFVNSLAILIFLAQVPYFIGISNMTYVFVTITLLIIYILPRLIKTIPSPLIAIVILPTITIYANLELRTVGELGSISRTLPKYIILNFPFTVVTLMIIIPYSVALTIVGLLKSLLTASIVDEQNLQKQNKK